MKLGLDTIECDALRYRAVSWPRLAWDPDAKPHQAGASRILTWEEWERAVRDIEVLPVSSHTEGGGGRPVEPVGGGQQRRNRAVRRHGHDSVEWVRGSVEIAIHVESEVVERYVGGMDAPCSCRAVLQNREGDDVRAVRNRDVDLIAKDLQAVRPRRQWQWNRR